MTASCTTVATFEKSVPIPNHSWQSSFKPEMSFEITDTIAQYRLYIVLRHTDAYRYKNIWINLQMQSPGSQVRNESLELQLATDDKGWLGSGMDDIYEHRIAITPPERPEPLKAGAYTFRIEQIMREDPLEHVMNVGVRLEKVN